MKIVMIIANNGNPLLYQALITYHSICNNKGRPIIDINTKNNVKNRTTTNNNNNKKIIITTI